MLDLFAGSGLIRTQLYQEGAEFFMFLTKVIENYKILKNNITNCKVEEISSIYNNDFRKRLC